MPSAVELWTLAMFALGVVCACAVIAGLRL